MKIGDQEMKERKMSDLRPWKDIPTRNLTRYVEQTEVNLSRVSRDTGIPYAALYDSLGKNGTQRSLRAGELLSVCKVLGLDPMSFATDHAGEWSMKIGDQAVDEIQVLTDEDELIVSITTENVIEKDGYRVVCVPSCV